MGYKLTDKYFLLKNIFPPIYLLLFNPKNNYKSVFVVLKINIELRVTYSNDYLKLVHFGELFTLMKLIFKY